MEDINISEDHLKSARSKACECSTVDEILALLNNDSCCEVRAIYWKRFTELLKKEVIARSNLCRTAEEAKVLHYDVECFEAFRKRYHELALEEALVNVKTCRTSSETEKLQETVGPYGAKAVYNKRYHELLQQELKEASVIAKKLNTATEAYNKFVSCDRSNYEVAEIYKNRFIDLVNEKIGSCKTYSQAKKLYDAKQGG